MNSKPELVSFSTSDHLELPGLFFEPPKPTGRLVIWLHGNGSASIFYKVKKMNLLADKLTSIGWAFLPFNNRGAHYLKKFSWKENEEEHEILQGTALEKIEDAVLDLDAAIAFARSRGYDEIVLAGESSGANKIVVYNLNRSENSCRGYALIGGGDDTGLFYLMFGKEKFWKVLKEARERVSNGNDDELLSPKLTEPKFAYRALADMLDPDGPYNLFPFYEYFSGERLGNKELFGEYKRINTPTLILYGELDKFCYRPAAEVVPVLLKIHPKPELLTGVVAPGADHSFSGNEEQEADAVVQWLQTTFP